MGEIWQFTIFGETPCKKNGQSFNRKSKSMYKKAPFYRWHGEALKTLLASVRPDRPLTSAKIEITFYHSDIKRRDGDGALTSIQDLLQDAGIIEDDRWQLIGTPTVTHDVAPAPYVQITVQKAAPIDWAAKIQELKKRAKA